LGSKLDEVAGEWRKLHNEELHNLYSFPSVIRQIKSRRMRWAEHVAGMGEEGKSTRSWWESRRKETTLKTEA
jgi:Asp-tRNA(Asn)/Glu-tRNA(Gln) amidotransferase B subunit